MSDSWWTKKLGQGAAPPQQPQVQQPQQAQHYPVQYQQPVQQAPQQPAFDPKKKGLTMNEFNERLTQYNPQEVPPEAQSHRVDPGGCPRCGSANFFSRKGSSGPVGAPAPHCFDCGFNTMFTPFGGEY